MVHDEIRIANCCRACQMRKMSAGELLASNVAECIRILKQTYPAAKIVVCSDMFEQYGKALLGKDAKRQ